jgi:nitrile hydratase subunit beta
MNGAHDLGGMMGFGPINAPALEPVFHQPWEARMFGMMLAVGDVGGWSIDADRAACEAMAPADYLGSSYYEHWLHGLGLLLAKYHPDPNARPTQSDEVWAAAHARGSYIRSCDRPQGFAIGQPVRVKMLSPVSHTRAPRYIRGCVGVIMAYHGPQVYPDDNALGLGENPQHLYGVQFTTAALWGRPGPDTVHVDLWEPYLDAC